MGVYINGMAMPHDCDECKLCAFIPVGDYGINRKCMPLNAKAEITIRRKDCPLFPVPPHGRLIDADALYSHIKDEQRKCNDPYDGWSECQVALGFVNTAPTIIPAEEGET